MTESANSIYKRPAELLQNLIRFNTANPPGNEKECILYIKNLLEVGGYETTILAKDEGRPNLIARLEGEGRTNGLLLYGHVDVVPVGNQDWSQPPFEGKIEDGFIWGRGALDMKSGVAMMVSAFLRAKSEGLKPAGDITLVIVSDEEGGSDYGAGFLTEKHAGLFKGIRYGIGEFGGFSVYIGGQKFYPVQVAEKQVCWMKTVITGKGGHASLPLRNGAMARTAAMLQKLNEQRLPVHIHPEVRNMLETMAGSVSDPMSSLLRGLTVPSQTDAILDQMGPQGNLFEAMLHNSVNATMIHGGTGINVLPTEITVRMDGRILPPYTRDDFIHELRVIIGEEISVEIEHYREGSGEPDMGWYETLAGILKESDPDGIPVPFLLPGVTDAAYFSKLGIQTYGFLPMNLPPDLDFLSMIHAADERIPVGAVQFGADAIYEAMKRMKR